MTTNQLGYMNAVTNQKNAQTNVESLEETKRHNRETERMSKWQTALAALI